MYAKNWVVGFMICAGALMPSNAHAQGVGSDYQNLLNVFGWLSMQAATLRAQLYATSIETSTPLPEIGTYRSMYYDGPYVSFYRVTDEGLVLAYGYSNDFHARVFSLFEKIAGRENALTYIQEVRIYNDPEAEYSAFVDEMGTTDRWILGVNIADVFPNDEQWEVNLAQLLIHEYAHILFYYQSDVPDAFVSRFWTDTMKRSASVRESISDASRRESVRDEYYALHKRTYVSPYATTNSEEDLAESFLAFVTEARGSGDSVRSQKQNFFYTYAALTEIRTRIRTNLSL
jgi:hypothetical protein